MSPDEHVSASGGRCGPRVRGATWTVVEPCSAVDRPPAMGLTMTLLMGSAFSISGELRQPYAGKL